MVVDNDKFFTFILGFELIENGKCYIYMYIFIFIFFLNWYGIIEKSPYIESNFLLHCLRWELLWDAVTNLFRLSFVRPSNKCIK